MLNIYFDDALIDNDHYTYLDNDYKLFSDNTNFRLGATACNSFKLSVDKSVISSHPTNVRIEDGTTTFHLIIDSIENDDFQFTYTLVDKLMLFNFNYDASEIINTKKELYEDCYLSDIWHDMCNKAGVEYDEDYIFLNDMVVNWYDNRKQARQYLSYIAERQYGFARINEFGKQTFIKQNNTPKKTIDIDECGDFVLGEKKTISRVVYDNGITKYAFGDDSGATIYLNPENVYITDEAIVENIYNELVGFEFYSLTVKQCPIDSSIRAGDIIVFSDGVNNYPTIAQYSTVFNGSWSGGYSIQVTTEQQQETQVLGLNTKVRNLQSNMDYLNSEMTIVSEVIDGLTDFIRNVGTTNNYLEIPNTPNSNGAINTLNIKGFNLMPLYPGMSYPSDYTYPGALSFYKLIFDNVSTFDNNPQTVYINSPIALQQLNAGLNVHYDEIKIEQNKVKVIQRIAYDFDNQEYYILTEPIEHELENVILPTFENSTFVKVLYFDNLIFDCEYIQKNDWTSNFSTQLESSSQFLLNQNEISQRVKKDNLISEINLSTEEAQIIAPKISLNGYISNKEKNFEITPEGKAKFVEAEITGGNVYLPSGGKVIGGDGLLANLQFQSDGQYENFSWLGFNYSSAVSMYSHGDVSIEVDIPENFTIVSAFLTLYHTPIYWYDFQSSTEFWGYSRNLKLYKTIGNQNYQFKMAIGSEYEAIISTGSLSEITNAFGSSSYTPSNTSGSNIEIKKTIDIKSNLNIGRQKLIVRTNNSLPTNNTIFCQQTGIARAVLNVIGYMRIDE